MGQTASEWKTVETVEGRRRHLEFFELALERARREIIIETPWIRGRRAEEFCRRLPAILARGVAVRVYYGYSDRDDSRDDPALVARLKELLGDRLVRLHDRWQTHKKVLVVDGVVLIAGSFNWLSGSGNKGELSVLVRGEAAREVARGYGRGRCFT